MRIPRRGEQMRRCTNMMLHTVEEIECNGLFWGLFLCVRSHADSWSYRQAGPPAVIWHFPCLLCLPFCDSSFHNFGTPLTPPAHSPSPLMILLSILLRKRKQIEKIPTGLTITSTSYLHLSASTFSPVALSVLSVLLRTASPSVSTILSCSIFW